MFSDSGGSQIASIICFSLFVKVVGKRNLDSAMTQLPTFLFSSEQSIKRRFFPFEVLDLVNEMKY